MYLKPKSKLAASIKVALFGTTMLAALGGAAAYAQENQNPQNQTENESASSEESVEVIDVKGIRGALATAAEIKRESDTFVDSINASDASALPDLSVAEALSRIPGLTVTRFTSGGSSGDFPSPEGSGNLIRGLGFVRSEFNGRDAFSANGGRALDWSAVPPELIGGVDVYKNQSADLIEGGIGGSINLRTLEPFDRQGATAIIVADTTYTDLREEWSPGFSGVFGNNYDTDSGKFGVIASYSTSDLASDINGYQSGAPTPRDNIEGTTGTVAIVPGFQLRTNEVDRTRDSYYLSGQWRSDDENLEILGKYVRVENEINAVERTTEWFPDFATSGRVGIEDIVLNPFTSAGIARCNGSNEPSVGDCDELIPVDGGLMESGIVTDTGDSWYGAYGVQVSNLGIGKRETSMTEDISLNIKYRASDQWFLEFDAHQTNAESTYNDQWIGSNTWLNVFTRPDSDNPELQFFIDDRLAIGEGQIFDQGTNQQPYVRPTTTADPGGYFLPFANDAFREGEGELTAVRGDATFEFEDNDWFKSIKFGARYSEREQLNQEAASNWQGLTQPWNGGLARFNAFDTEVHEVVDFSDFFRGGVVTGDNTSFVYIDSDLLRNPTDFYNFLANEPDIHGGASYDPTLNANGSPRRTSDGNYTQLYQPGDISDIVEETMNLYVRADFLFDINNDMYLEGNFGVRYVKVDVSSEGTLQYNPLGPDVQQLEQDPPVENYTPEIEAMDDPRDFLPESAAFSEQANTPIVTNIEEDHFLPSFNAKLNLNEDMLIRFGISKAMTRPNVQDMRASQTVNTAVSRVQFPPLEEGDPGFGLPRGLEGANFTGVVINGGNALLESTTATNWDLSYEWYFEDGGYVTAAVFGKELENIFTYGPQVLDTVTLDGQTANETFVGVVNQDDASIKGAEIAYQQFYPNLPGIFQYLGLQANYTYIDAEATPPPAFLDNDNDGQPDPGSFESLFRFGRRDLLGQSDHTANIIGIYQDEELELRLAYNWRSEYLNSYRDFVSANPIIQEAAGFLDFSARYDITENLQVAFLAANVLDTKSKSKTQIDEAGQEFQRSSFLNDRRFKFSIRYQY
jgi:TonB-dependent receptor